jgi:hypothetical protein
MPQGMRDGRNLAAARMTRKGFSIAARKQHFDLIFAAQNLLRLNSAAITR